MFHVVKYIGVSKTEQLVQNVALMEKGPLPRDVRKACDTAWDLLRGDYYYYHR